MKKQKSRDWMGNLMRDITSAIDSGAPCDDPCAAISPEQAVVREAREALRNRGPYDPHTYL